MAKSKKEAAKAEKPEKVEKKGKKEVDQAKVERRKARMEAIKNRPAGQRPNSKQIDVIQIGKSEVRNFAMPIRNVGSLITSVVLDKDGNPIGTSVTLVEGVSPKVKKGHGSLVHKLPGVGKNKASKDTENDEEEEDDEDEDDED